jgi:hypothetical protein
VTPASLPELVDLVQRAEREGTTVRAVGAGHSWSNVALTDGYLILPDKLSGVERVGERLVRVLGGTHLRDLNDWLDEHDLALPQMGGYDEQTIAGVISTSTHGSGLSWGPFPDFVRSLELVVSGGELVQLEPGDDGFDAAICGVGTIGIIHAVIIEVREAFWLNEVRTDTTWENVRDELTPERVLGEGDHYELFLNPYGEHRVLVTRRRDWDGPRDLPEDKLRRHPLTELEARLKFVAWFLRLGARFVPGLLAGRFDAVLHDMRDNGYANKSYRVFNIGEANHLPAISAELAIPLAGNRHIEAVERIFTIAAEQRKRHRRIHTSPIALRFVARSRAYASMMHDRETMMIELILVDTTRGAGELLQAYEDGLRDLEMRPHWGQINNLTDEEVRTMYPRWDDWLAVEQRFNASGVFGAPPPRRS